MNFFYKLNIQYFASKKGVGSTKNGRDSHSKRLGAKKSDGEFATAGSILYRQRGTKMHPGVNVKRGSDDTLYSLITGYVKFERFNKNKSRVSVYKEKINLNSNLSQKPKSKPSRPLKQVNKEANI